MLGKMLKAGPTLTRRLMKCCAVIVDILDGGFRYHIRAGTYSQLNLGPAAPIPHRLIPTLCTAEVVLFSLPCVNKQTVRTDSDCQFSCLLSCLKTRRERGNPIPFADRTEQRNRDYVTSNAVIKLEIIVFPPPNYLLLVARWWPPLVDAFCAR